MTPPGRPGSSQVRPWTRPGAANGGGCAEHCVAGSLTSRGSNWVRVASGAGREVPAAAAATGAGWFSQPTSVANEEPGPPSARTKMKSSGYENANAGTAPPPPGRSGPHSIDWLSSGGRRLLLELTSIPRGRPAGRADLARAGRGNPHHALSAELSQ